jgi:hypothetical protein
MVRLLEEVPYSMIVSLPAAAGEARRVIFMRATGPPFTERTGRCWSWPPP